MRFALVAKLSTLTEASSHARTIWSRVSPSILTTSSAALAGVLLVLIQTAHPNMSQPLLIMGFAVVIVAGLGNLLGAVVLGLVIGLLEAMFGQYVETYFKRAFIYGLMIVVLLIRPQGLFGRV